MNTKKSKKEISSKHGKDHDNNIFEPNASLYTEKCHKDWFHPETMGKQRGKPRYDLRENKKKKK